MKPIYRERISGRYYPYETPLPEIDYSINPYFGCEAGCRYCYSIYYFKIKNIPYEWGGYIEAKLYLPRELAKKLDRFRRGSIIAIGTYIDPYQPLEARLKLTRRVIKVLRWRKDLHISIQTRFPLVLRDMDLIASGPADVGTSIPSTEKRFLDVFEPKTPSPYARAKMLGRFVDEGIETWIYYAPVLPWINDDPSMFEEVVDLAINNGVDTIYTDIVRFRIGVKEHFLKYLRHYDPSLIERYRGLGRKELYRWYRETVEKFSRVAREKGIEYIDAEPMMFRT